MLRTWGLRNLLQGSNPLHERMTWFWHNHFTTSTERVRFGIWMARHDLILRKHALGNFGDLLREASLSAAMLIYLDGRRNVKNAPNENFARELLELFTLGEGHYTEKDVKEAARALTGWVVDERHDRVVFVPARHDHGVKTFLGRRGRFNAFDIFEILQNHPRTAEFICEKMWREFISVAPPDKNVIKQWARVYRKSGLNMRVLLRTILHGEPFWANEHRGALVKSPIDLVAGTLRAVPLEGSTLTSRQITNLLAQMGLVPYQPPSVAGWNGGLAWVDDARLMARRQFLHRISRGSMLPTKMPKNSVLPPNKLYSPDHPISTPWAILPTPAELPRTHWAEWLLAVPPFTRETSHTWVESLRTILLDPTYQVK